MRRGRGIPSNYRDSTVHIWQSWSSSFMMGLNGLEVAVVDSSIRHGHACNEIADRRRRDGEYGLSDVSWSPYIRSVRPAAFGYFYILYCAPRIFKVWMSHFFALEIYYILISIGDWAFTVTEIFPTPASIIAGYYLVQSRYHNFSSRLVSSELPSSRGTDHSNCRVVLKKI